MSYLTEQEIKELDKCKTVKEMLETLSDRFDLNIAPPIVSRVMILSGLKTAINLLQPKRK